MSQPDHKQIARAIALARRAAYGPVIEWEELPSLAGSLGKRLVHRGAGAAPAAVQASAGAPAWDATMPAVLEPVYESDPFREPVDGVAVRELREPELFRHFFD